MGSLNIHILLILCSSHMGSCSRISKQKIVPDETACLYYSDARGNRYLYGPFPQAAVTLWAKFLLKQWFIFLDWLPDKWHWTNSTYEWDFLRFGQGSSEPSFIWVFGSGFLLLNFVYTNCRMWALVFHWIISIAIFYVENVQISAVI